MKLRHILALILALAMIVSFAACGSTSTDNTDSSSSSTSSTNTSTKNEPEKSTDTGLEIVETENFISREVPRGVVYENTDETMAAKKTDAKTLVIGGNSSIVKAEPNTSLYSQSQDSIYNRLIEYNIETGEYEPSLATKWEQIDDTTFEIWLRDDVYFHYGQKFTADDVIYSLERLKDPNLDPKWFDQFAAIDINNIDVVDDYHLIYHFNYSWGAFLEYFSCPWGGIMCREYVTENGEDSFWDAPNGTGPFIQTEAVSGEKFVMEKNDNYWGECDTGYDTIIYKYYSDTSTMFIDFEAGNLDIIYQVAPEDCERILNGDLANVNLQTVERGAPQNLCMYTYGSETGIGDRDLREALMRSLDTDTITEVCMGILGIKSSKISTGSMPYVTDQPYGYDPDKAKELVAQSNYDGSNIIMSTNTTRDHVVFSEIIQSMAAEAGINIEILRGDAATHSARGMGINNGGIPENDISLFNVLVISSCPQMMFSQFKTGSGYALGSTQDEYLNALLTEGEQTADAARVAEIYDEVSQIFYDQVILTPLCDVYEAVAYYDYVNYWPINWTKHDVFPNITLAV